MKRELIDEVGHQLRIPELRFWPLKRFPYVVFYAERKTYIKISRVLHSEMDVPSWLAAGDRDNE